MPKYQWTRLGSTEYTFYQWMAKLGIDQAKSSPRRVHPDVIKQKEADEKKKLRESRAKRTKECLQCVEAIEDWFRQGGAVPKAIDQKIMKQVNGPDTAQMNATWNMTCTTCNADWSCLLQDSDFMPKYFWFRNTGSTRVSFDDWLRTNNMS